MDIRTNYRVANLGSDSTAGYNAGIEVESADQSHSLYYFNHLELQLASVISTAVSTRRTELAQSTRYCKRLSVSSGSENKAPEDKS